MNDDTAPIPPAPDEWLSVAEAVELTGYHPQTIRALARDDRVRWRRFGRRAYQIERAALLAYIEARRAEGQKRGPRPDESD